MKFITTWADAKWQGEIDGDVYGPMQFDAGFFFRQLIEAHSSGRLLGAVGICFTHRSVLIHSAETREAVGRILQFIPQDRFFVWDDLSVSHSLHYGVATKLGGHPAWLPSEGSHVGFYEAKSPIVVNNVQMAFRIASCRYPMILHLPLGTEGGVDEVHTDLSAHELYRWAKQFGFLDAMITTKDVSDEDRQRALVLGRAALNIYQDEARSTLNSLRKSSPSSISIADGLFGGHAQEVPGMRRFEPGQEFDPSTHYDDYYYGVGGKGILYPTREGNWKPYRGTAHEWEGNKIIAGFVTRLVDDGHFLLDLGCGSGDFVWRMSQLGWNSVGVDISDSGKKVSKVPDSIIVADVTDQNNSLEELNNIRGTQDVVTALDFYEHIFEKDLDPILDVVFQMLRHRGVHLACICTRGDKEEDQVFAPGVKVTPENAWCLVSGHVNVRTWGWWMKQFRRHGFKACYRRMTFFQVLREQDPGLRDCRSWGARNVCILEKK